MASRFRRALELGLSPPSRQLLRPVGGDYGIAIYCEWGMNEGKWKEWRRYAYYGDDSHTE